LGVGFYTAMRELSQRTAPLYVLNVLELEKVNAVKVPSLLAKTPRDTDSLLPKFISMLLVVIVVILFWFVGLGTSSASCEYLTTTHPHDATVKINFFHFVQKSP